MSYLFCGRCGWGTFSREHDNIIGKRKVKGVEGDRVASQSGFIVYPPASSLNPFRSGAFPVGAQEIN
jgi:hypothetical protein